MGAQVDFDVIINGGGPVGMGLAIELGQRGISVCVVERFTAPQPIPKGQNLTQRSVEHFQAWHCSEELVASHSLPKDAGIGGMTLFGSLLSDHAVDWFNRAAVGAYYFAPNMRVPQYKTEAVLRARVAALPSVSVRYGWRGQSYSQDDDRVSLTLQQEEGGDRATLSARYLVGADGSRSMVRDMAKIPQIRTEHDRLMALLVFDSEELHTLLQRHPGKAIYKVLRRDLDGFWMFFGRVDHGSSWFFHAPVPLGTTTENYDFGGLLCSAVGQRFAFDLTYRGLWELRTAYAERYRDGRVFVAGDAAHSHPPYGGYGINTGLEDARNLGWKLAATLQGWGGEGLLDSYDAERRPVFVSTARDFIDRYIEKDRKFLAEARPDKNSEAFDRAWRLSQSDTWDVDNFEPNYEGSPVMPFSNGAPSAVGKHSFEARVGHLLPPPGPDGDRSLREQFGEDLTLLTAEPVYCAEFSQAAQELKIPLTIRAMPSGAGEMYRADCILLRPDRFVVWTGETTASPRELLLRSLGHRVSTTL